MILQIWLPANERPFIESQLRAAYTGLLLSPISERSWSRGCVGVADLRLAWGNYLPIRTAFESEPLANVLWMLAGVPADHEVALQIIIRPKSSRWQLQAQGEAQRLHDGQRGWEALVPGLPTRVTPSRFEKMRAKAITEKAASVGFDSFMRVAAAAGHAASVRHYVRMVAASLAPYAAANSFRLGHMPGR